MQNETLHIRSRHHKVDGRWIAILYATPSEDDDADKEDVVILTVEAWPGDVSKARIGRLVADWVHYAVGYRIWEHVEN